MVNLQHELLQEICCLKSLLKEPRSDEEEGLAMMKPLLSANTQVNFIKVIRGYSKNNAAPNFLLPSQPNHGPGGTSFKFPNQAQHTSSQAGLEDLFTTRARSITTVSEGGG